MRKIIVIIFIVCGFQSYAQNKVVVNTVVSVSNIPDSIRLIGTVFSYRKNGVWYDFADFTSFTDTSNLSRRINYKPRVFNVEEYGAVHDGVTNDVTGIQAAINACDSLGGGIVWFPSSNKYTATSALVTNVAGSNPNSQIYIPAHDITGVRNDIILLGEANNFVHSGYSTLVVAPAVGVTITSQINGSGAIPSVIGTIGTVGSYQNYNFNSIRIYNLTVRTYTDHGTQAPSMNGINMRYASQIDMDNVSVGLDTSNQASINPVNNEVAGIIAGGVNNDRVSLNKCYVGGYKYGFIIGEHAVVNTYSFSNYYGYVFSGNNYTVTGKILYHACPYGILYPTTTILGQAAGKSYVNLDVESEIDSTGVFATLWYKSRKAVLDSGNNGRGSLRFQSQMAYTATTVNSSLSFYKGDSLNIQDFEGHYISNQKFLGGTTSSQYRLSDLNTAPSSSTDTGTKGDIRWTSTYIYLCTDNNTWVRASLSTW